MALYETTDISNTAQLLIFVRVIPGNFETTEELLSTESMKGTTTKKIFFIVIDKTISKNGRIW